MNVFPVSIPPLRERRDDIPLLANHFVRKFAAKMNKEITRISVEGLKALQDYDYPGNVRELENLIERAVILTSGDTLECEHLRLDTIQPQRQVFSVGGNQTLKDFERGLILQTLKETGWRIGGAGGAAAKLGLKRTTLMSKMEKLRVSRQLL
jgi:formate hydrogenlyase transcriptional activator